jgi:ferritin-like metal-binding protein YciE
LEQTLEEEKQTDARLTEIAEHDVNYAAAEEEKIIKPRPRKTESW